MKVGKSLHLYNEGCWKFFLCSFIMKVGKSLHLIVKDGKESLHLYTKDCKESFQFSHLYRRRN